MLANFAACSSTHMWAAHAATDAYPILLRVREAGLVVVVVHCMYKHRAPHLPALLCVLCESPAKLVYDVSSGR